MESYQHALIIDDDPDLCLLLKEMLKIYIPDVQYVHTLYNGRKLIKTIQPDIVFVDNNLPDGQGIAIIKEIKASFPGVWIVVISAMGAIKQDAYALGADIFVEKPLTELNLLKALEIKKITR